MDAELEVPLTPFKLGLFNNAPGSGPGLAGTLG